MADNVAVTAGSGTTVAADEVSDGTLGSCKVQFVKLMDGTLDGTTKAAVGANGLKVDPTSAVAMGSGANGATVQRVALATDSPPGTAAYSSVVSITRTNDTNAYAANDVIGAATGSTAGQDFALGAPSGGRIMITSVALEIDATAVISGETSYRLYLYNVTPPSATGDNGAWDLPAGDRASFLGYVDLGTPVDLGSTLYVEVNGINKQVKLAGTDIFAYLVTIGAYTPTASRVYVITLHAVGL